MKIAIFHQPVDVISLRGQYGSIEIWTYEVARRLAQSCDVIVYTKRGRYQNKVEYDQGVEYRRISTAFDEWFRYVDKLGYSRVPGFRNLRRILFFRNARRPFFASRLHYLTYALQVAKDLRKEKCDIVHVINFSQFVPIIRMFNPKIRIVLNMRCEWLTQLDRVTIRRRLREADLVMGCSEYITEKVRHRFPQFAKRCQTVYSGIDVNHFVCKKDDNMTKQNGIRRLLFVGRVSPEKGVHVLLDAYKKVVDHYPQTQLKIVGGQASLPIWQAFLALTDDPKLSDLRSFYNGNYTLHLKRKLSSGLASHVSFTGPVPHRQLTDFYQDADVLVFPSVWEEPFGRPIIEAMAMGVSVVAARGGGIPEIVVNGETGLLVERGDASALAEAILRLLSDHDLRKSMGKAARKRVVELFSWEKTVENLLHHYRNLCEGDD